MKKFILHYIDVLVLFIYRRIKLVKNKDVEILKEKKKEKLLYKGYGLKLNGSHWVFSQPKKIILGNNIHIGNNAYFKSEGGIIIGDNTHISRNVTIYTVNHNYNGRVLPYDESSDHKPVEIEENVWIGMNVVIVPGVKIGKGAIIGIGTVVNRNVEPLEIVGSPKIQSLKFRDTDHYKRLNHNQKYGGINGKALKPNELNLFKSTYEQNKDKEIIFILGTGRSGTKSITDVLNKNPKCKALHENILQLIRIGSLFEYDKDEIYLNEIKRIFEHKIYEADQSQTLILSDQRFWNLIPFLSSYFKNAKFIHVVRNPLDSILSMASRGWYQPNEYPEIVNHDWAKYRLDGAKCGFYSQEDWQSLSPIEKCAWYYAFVNRSIEKSLLTLSTEQYLRVELNNLDEDINKLAEFIGYSDFEFTPMIKNVSRPEYAENKKQIDKEKAKKEIDSILNKVNNVFDKS